MLAAPTSRLPVVKGAPVSLEIIRPMQQNAKCDIMVRSMPGPAHASVASSSSSLRAQRVIASAAASSSSPPSADRSPKKKLAVFVSGGGSNFKAIHAACLDGRINAEVAVVVSDKVSCGGTDYAAKHSIPSFVYPKTKSGVGLSPQELTSQLKETLGVDYVILAGYLKLIPAELVRVYPRAIVNIHPGLLPSFGGKGLYGLRVHAAVISSGARFSGPTVHFVDEEYDTGPILSQRVVPVLPFDTPETLAARVLKEEHVAYPDAVSALCDGRITWRADGIPVIWTAH